MKTTRIFFSCLLLSAFGLFAQKSKVQGAWRALSDYEQTLKDGKPELSYLTKAKESIDAALTNEETKKQTRTHAYKLRISYATFQYNLAEELKKVDAAIQDKNERTLLAYGAVSLTDFEVATDELGKIKDMDQAFLDNIQAGIAKGDGSLDEDEAKFALAIQQMRVESSNIASGKYRAKKYDEAADYFYKTGFLNTLLNKAKDTASFYNACIAAAKAKNNDKILEYNKKMIDAKIASAYNYESISNVQLAKGDTNTAIETLKKGRASYPENSGLLTQETNLYLARGMQKEALANLKLSSQKDPNNALYYFIMGNIYDNTANPKDAMGKELPKPVNFEEQFKNAEINYQKAIDLKPANKEYLFNSYFNLGAMYNNYGGSIANRKAEKITDLARVQKENETKAQEYYKKAIPYLEQAHAIKTSDKATMMALRKLYKLTGNDAKALEMSEKLK